MLSWFSKKLLIVASSILFSGIAEAALSIPVTVHMSEPVIVSGIPRVAIDVGGQARYATYTSGSGTTALTFTLMPQAGDVDLDGIVVSSPIDLNGGALKDTAGNNAVLTFAPPNTSGIKVNYPSLGMDFVYDADGRYTLNGTAYNDLSSFLSAAGGAFTRTSAATYFDSAGVLQVAGANTPRFDYDPITHTPKGLLIEGAKTNMCKSSSQLSSAFWNPDQVSLSTDGTLDPLGQSAYKVAMPVIGPGNRLIYASVTGLIPGNEYTYSVFVKAGSTTKGAINLDFASPNVNYAFDLSIPDGNNVIPVGNGWYRVKITSIQNTSSVQLNLGFYKANDKAVNNSMYFSGVQFELGASYTSYIPTNGVTVARSADDFVIPVGGWYNSSEGTGLSYFFAGNAALNRAPFAFSDNTTNNRIHLYATSALSFNVYSGGALQAINGVYGAFSEGQAIKAALGYKLNDFVGGYNGGAPLADLGGSVPPVTQLAIGKLVSAGYLDTTIQRFFYYPLRIQNAQLPLLTQ